MILKSEVSLAVLRVATRTTLTLSQSTHLHEVCRWRAKQRALMTGVVTRRVIREDRYLRLTTAQHYQAKGRK